MNAKLRFPLILLVAVLFSFKLPGQAINELLVNPDDIVWKQSPPDSFNVQITSTKGNFVIRVVTSWAPIGATRFYHLVKNGFYDDSRFFRVKEGFIAQFGIPGNPEITKNWIDNPLQDDPVKQSNTRGFVTYAMTGPDTRTTQIYINLMNNSRLDSGGFAPFGKIISGMEVVDQLYSGYDEEAGGGMRLGKQQQMLTKGNAHLDKNFPKLDRLIKAELINRNP